MSKKESNLINGKETIFLKYLFHILILKHNSRQFEKESLIRFPDFVSIYRKR